MKIALLTYSTKPRGSVMHTLELAIALTERAHQVTVIALDKDGTGFDYPLPGDVQLVPAQPAPNDIDALIHQRIQEFVDFLSSSSPKVDIYHAQDCIGANALLALRQRGNIPHFVRTVHHVEDFRSPYLQACQEKSIAHPDLCLCVSQGWQQILKRDHGRDAALVGNGVNRDRFTPHPDGRETSLKARYGLTGSPIFLTIGGIEPRKNSINLLRAFAQVRRTLPTAQLVIAGGATLFDYQPYREQFFAVAQALDLPLDAALVLPGVIATADLPALYRCADAFCFPSNKEGWGLVVLEAIASGLPVIVSQQPPFTEFLDPDHAVWVNPADSDSIARGMQQAIADTASNLVSASQSVLTQYSWQRSAQLHENQYQQLLQSPSHLSKESIPQMQT
jgi:glycosyltransferase-like protein